MSRRLTPRGEQRRAELLEFATRRFAANGYHTTSVTELVDGLGVGKGVFYWYFDSKEELFIEILREGHDALRKAQQSAIGDEKHPIRRIVRGIEGSFEWWAAHADLYRLIQFATTETDFREAIRKADKTAVADVQRHIVAAVDQGLVPDTDAEVLAQAVLGVSAALARTQLLGKKRPWEDVAAEAVAFCLGGLSGLVTDEAQIRSA